ETFGELGPGTVAYFLAAHASTIWIQPSGTLGLTGVALDVMTFRGALDKVGAQPQFGQRHEYKSAAETFMSTEISAPNREMTQRIADSVMERVADRVCAARGLEPEAFTRAVADSPLTATQARDAGLVDRIGYRHDIYAELRSQFGTDDGRI